MAYPDCLLEVFGFLDELDLVVFASLEEVPTFEGGEFAFVALLVLAGKLVEGDPLVAGELAPTGLNCFVDEGDGGVGVLLPDPVPELLREVNIRREGLLWLILLLRDLPPLHLLLLAAPHLPLLGQPLLLVIYNAYLTIFLLVGAYLLADLFNFVVELLRFGHISNFVLVSLLLEVVLLVLGEPLPLLAHLLHNLEGPHPRVAVNDLGPGLLWIKI